MRNRVLAMDQAVAHIEGVFRFGKDARANANVAYPIVWRQTLA